MTTMIFSFVNPEFVPFLSVLTVMAVHNGLFHADDALCVALVETLLCREVKVLRTRNPQDWAVAGIIADVGGKDEVTQTQVWVDHHQEDSGCYPSGLKKAACGKLLDLLVVDGPVREYLHEHLFDAVEAHDNGQEWPLPSLLSFVSVMNTNWKEGNDGADKQFRVAVDMVKVVLRRVIAEAEASVEAKEVVEQAISSSDGGVVILPNNAPWKEGVCAANEGRAEKGHILYAVFPSQSDWGIMPVPQSATTFESWKPIPEKFSGLRGEEEMAKVIGLPGGVFFHKGRFFAIFHEKKVAVKFARMCVAN